ncbi:MAG: hypothetical protein EPO23_05835 [Xanthobacteraceae bacterium]|nr:MAG: hypothetical protein EPO23_05835 [Xanthobacteraceae bacterium]
MAAGEFNRGRKNEKRVFRYDEKSQKQAVQMRRVETGAAARSVQIIRIFACRNAASALGKTGPHLANSSDQ